MKIKKWSLILVVLLFIIVILLGILKLNNNNNNNNQEEYAPDGKDAYEYKEIEKDNSKTIFYIISECVNKSSKKYYYANEIYRLNREEGNIFFTYGIEGNNEKYYIVYLDYINSTYKVQEINNDEYNDVKKAKNLDKYQVIEIKKNSSNSFEVMDMTNEKIAERYFDIIKNLFIYQPMTLYNLLDENYKKDNFKNLEEYSKFIKQNKEKIKNAKMKSYTVERKDKYIQYICTSSGGEEYIINEISTTNYSIILNNI